MSGLVLLWSSLFAAIPSVPSAIPDADRAAYQAAKVETGRDPEAHVKLALWCEAHGLPEERAKHLAIATLIDPHQATARGLMGLVSLRDRWVRPEKVDAELKADAELAPKLAEYNARRARLDRLFGVSTRQPGHQASPTRARAHLQLGLWCEKAGLPAEASVQFTTAVILDPRNKTAWHHLGYTRQPDGRWRTAKQVADERAETEAQRLADHTWERRLKAWYDGLSAPAGRTEALAALSRVDDPRAVPSIARVFAADGSALAEIGVQLLGRIDTPPSSQRLAEIAMGRGTNPLVQAEAIEALKGRSPRDYAGGLVEAIHTPIRYWVEPVRGPGSPGALVVETPRFRMTRTYDAPPVFNISATFFGYVGYDVNGLPLIDSGREERALTKEDPYSRARDLAMLEMRTAEMITAANLRAYQSQQILRSDIASIAESNFVDAERAEQIVPLLQKALGAPADLGVDEVAWHRWYYDKIGYSYTPPRLVTLAVNASPQPSAPTIFSCFAAGTLVRTLDGHRPIETLGAGEQVLAQDAATGALAFRPINFVHHNPPAATLRITIGTGETIVPSTYHRFWRVGKGWTLARELAAGDVLRTLGGTARVAEVSAGKVEPVYNLDVAGDHTFFVGPVDALVRDNTLPDDHARPFDAPAPILASALNK